MHRVLVNKWHTIDETIPAKEMKVIVELVNKTATLIAGLATKLRLTNQSRYTPQAANTASKKSTPLRPWETAKAG